MSKELTLTVDRRELATILAALRFHQDENLRIGPDIPDRTVKDIATDCGSFKPLDYDDVSRLCERMNLGDEAAIENICKDAKDYERIRIWRFDENDGGRTKSRADTSEPSNNC